MHHKRMALGVSPPQVRGRHARLGSTAAVACKQKMTRPVPSHPVGTRVITGRQGFCVRMVPSPQSNLNSCSCHRVARPKSTASTTHGANGCRSAKNATNRGGQSVTIPFIDQFILLLGNTTGSVCQPTTRNMHSPGSAHRLPLTHKKVTGGSHAMP